MKTGTPQSLNTAIYNGLKEAVGASEQEAIMMAEAIEPHIKDFLAQRFGAMLLTVEDKKAEEAIADLWFKVFGKRIK